MDLSACGPQDGKLDDPIVRVGHSKFKNTTIFDLFFLAVNF